MYCLILILGTYCREPRLDEIEGGLYINKNVVDEVSRKTATSNNPFSF